MLGHSHAMSGLAAGAAALPWAPAVGVTGVTGQVAWVAAWGGFAMLPDLDQGGLHWRGAMPRLSGSTVARMWGPVTTTFAGLVSVLARGHRNGTHDLLLAPAAFGGLALLAGGRAWSSLLVLALAIGLALQACHVVVPGRVETTVVGNLALSFGGAWWLTGTGSTALEWLPWAVAGGVVVHVVGDWLTVGGVPVPLTWLLDRPKRVSASLFRTGARVEHWAAGAFAATALVLLYRRTALHDLLGPVVGPVIEPVVALAG
ncbi:metal-dependent hydrolase [Quadrisphaera sp. DSM 44207]|uniref:metal-dependent hydrolase n=1 Tax=Quadrisphaera sp. DSM 44207 TaxID=1881057 RepID=UPI00088C511A|nr:metal-dependent hydrolase [Quadrisphaera sp. DSM 44207]SDQ42516.1 LexA-binding, inner membrane-associated putative hydrolase [Quadrisphaera sp. DSM 44207]